jgi:hypothetical protein
MDTMASPQLTMGLVQRLSAAVAQYIASQREAFLPSAFPLTEEQRLAMEGFFVPEVIDGARLVVLHNNRVQNPNFYSQLRQLGIRNLLDFGLMAAITFGNVVVSHQPFTHGLLFHELVHVEQYRQLGIPQFSNLYVRGFLTGGGYEGIPLERNAYTLGVSFEANPQQRFSVSAEVAEWVRHGRF